MNIEALITLGKRLNCLVSGCSWADSIVSSIVSASIFVVILIDLDTSDTSRVVFCFANIWICFVTVGGFVCSLIDDFFGVLGRFFALLFIRGRFQKTQLLRNLPAIKREDFPIIL